MKFIDAKQTPPPFGKYISVLFNDEHASDGMFNGDFVKISKFSPNDEAEGCPSEFRSYEIAEKMNTLVASQYQFYLQPISLKWMGDIDPDTHGDSDFIDLYSDSIAAWAELPTWNSP